MRKSFFISFLSLIIIFSSAFFTGAAAQVKTEAEVKKLLCHKWKLTHYETEGEKTPEAAGPTLLFKDDGTMIHTADGEESKGKWKYDHKTTTLTLDDQYGVKEAKIGKIIGTELVLKAMVEGEGLTMFFKKID